MDLAAGTDDAARTDGVVAPVGTDPASPVLECRNVWKVFGPKAERIVGTPAADLPRAELARSDGSVIWRRARADGSYASANDSRVLVGLGTVRRPVRVRVAWPDGVTETFGEVPPDRYTTLVRGKGTPAAGR